MEKVFRRMSLFVHPAGRIILFVVSVLYSILFLLSLNFVKDKYFLFLVIIGCVTFLFFFYFFRNPERIVAFNNQIVYAPADGKIVMIAESFEDEYLKKNCIKVSIFMSMLNVHVNRYPISGVIKYSKYHPGRYFIAHYPKASEFNEHNTIVIETEEGESVLVKQIAGTVARRIVCYANVGRNVVQGEDLGFIKFGSRVDLFLPIGADLVIKNGQKVKGNKTVIAYIKKDCCSEN